MSANANEVKGVLKRHSDALMIEPSGSQQGKRGGKVTVDHRGHLHGNVARITPPEVIPTWTTADRPHFGD